MSGRALHLHFLTQGDPAGAVLSEHHERMTAVLVRTEVKAGVQLAGHPSSEVAADVAEAYGEWCRAACSLITRVPADRSIRADADMGSCAELSNTAFVGSQVLLYLKGSGVCTSRRAPRAPGFHVAQGAQSPRGLETADPHRFEPAQPPAGDRMKYTTIGLVRGGAR